MSAAQTFRNTLVVMVTIGAAYMLYLSSQILVVLFIAIVAASAVRPLVIRLRKRGVSEGLSILLVYGLVALAIFVLCFVVLPPAARQFSGYLGNQQGFADRIIAAQTWIQQAILDRTGTQVTLLDPETIRTTMTQIMSQVMAAIPALASGFGGLLGDFVLVFVLGVYWLTARDETVKFVLQLLPLGRRAVAEEIIRESETSMGTYVRGLGLVCTFVGVANFIILSLLGVPNAVTLAFILGLTTGLPIIGGYIGAATATLLALLSSPLYAVFALGSFLLVQQVENHYLTPRVMSHSVGLDPLLVIVLLFTGFALGGVIGALIALPISSVLAILLRHLVIQPRKDETTSRPVDGGILLSGNPQSAAATSGIILTASAHDVSGS